MHGSPFSVSVSPGLACASTSTASGAGLSLATAGAASSFSVVARDRFGNLLDSTRTVCTTSVSCVTGTSLGVLAQYVPAESSAASSVTFSSSYAGNGVWDVLVSGQRVAGEYDSMVTLPYVGGLHATYYAYSTSLEAVEGASGASGSHLAWGTSTAPNHEAFIATVAKSAPQPVSISSSALPASLADDENGYAVRWAGYVRTPCASSCTDAAPVTYTFQFTVAAVTDRVRVWIDNAMVIDQWTSLASVSPTGTAPVRQAESMHDIRVWYRHDKATPAAAELNWKPTESGDATVYENVPTSRLYARHDIRGTPVKANVLPSTPSAVHTRAVGSGLSTATAGVQARFTVVVRDAYNNPIPITKERPFETLAVHRAHLTGANPLFSAADGQGAISYIPTRSGVYSSSMAFYSQGGLAATYYQATTVSGPPSRTVTALVLDICPAGGCGTSPTGSGLAGNSAFSARFSGVVRPEVSGYVFRVTVQDASDGVRLWLDNSLVIDSWSGLTGLVATATVTFSVARGYFEVAVDYR